MKATRTTLLVPFLSLLGFSAACGDLASPVDPNMGGAGAGGKSTAGASAGPGKAGAGGKGGAASQAGAGGGAQGGKGPQGGDAGEAGADGGGVLSLTKVTAQVVGRNGDAVRFSVEGTQPVSGAYSIAVTFEDDGGQPVQLFDADFNGSLESTDGRIAFDAPATTEAFKVTATMAGIANAAALTKAKVALVDGADQLSEELTATITQQAKLALGDACDKTNLKDRCDVGQSCSGTPAKCVVGVAPMIQELKYLHAGGGPLVLVRGLDPDDDVGKMRIELLDLANKPVTVDENSAPTSIIDTAVSNGSSAGSFFLSVKAGAQLEDKVPRVRVMVTDSLGGQSATSFSNIANVARAGNGGNCDSRGFSGCIADYVCSPGLPVAAGKCTKGTTARAAACAAAPKLDPDAGITVAAGRIDGVSLWEPPTGCVPDEITERPEGVVSLHLASAVSKLSISTHRPETNTDTHIYLIPSCAEDSSAALQCLDDDTDGFASALEVTDVPAGDYTIVIESRSQTGGSFGVSVSTN